jgi:hypothetical protein
MKDYQTEMLDAAIPLPASVSVAMEDIAATMREGLLAMAVAAGLSVMQALMEESVSALCGAKGRHLPERSAVRHGSEDGSVTLGGRRVPVRRRRVRANGDYLGFQNPAPAGYNWYNFERSRTLVSASAITAGDTFTLTFHHSH